MENVGMLAEQAIDMYNKVGKMLTIRYYRVAIRAMGKPKSYADMCKRKGLVRVLRFVEGDLRGVKQDYVI